MALRLVDRLLVVREGVLIAFDAIRANRVRAALTISGVAVGVFVVVAMGAAVHGVRQSFRQDLDEFGATTFTIRRRGISLGGCDGTDDTCPERRNPGITLDEWRRVRALPELQTVTARLFGEFAASYRDRSLKQVGFDAQSADWLETDAADIAPGRTFTEAEHNAGALVALVNDTLAARLFGDADPIGKEFTFGGQTFRVIGVFHTKAGFLKTMDQRGPDRPRVIIPFLSAWRHLDVWRRGLMLMAKPRPDVPQDVAMDAVTAALRSARGLKPTQPNNFALVTQDRLMDTFNQLFGAIFLVGLALSGVGLLVGGVGVVAIMMISVTERTREIGVRKALGATPATILWQFLVEAATLTSLGAGLGLVVGAGLTVLIRAATPIPAELPFGAVAAALAASALTGIVFGMVPAARAARLDPVEALRHE